MKSGNLNFLEPSGPLQVCNGTALPYLYKLIIYLRSLMDLDPVRCVVKKMKENSIEVVILFESIIFFRSTAMKLLYGHYTRK
jgi:hypothetical protein